MCVVCACASLFFTHTHFTSDLEVESKDNLRTKEGREGIVWHKEGDVTSESRGKDRGLFTRGVGSVRL